MKISRTVKQEQIITGTITKADLVDLIMGEVDVPYPAGVEPRIFVTVPNGGDYSGAQLLIGDDVALEFEIRWNDAEKQG